METTTLASRRTDLLSSTVRRMLRRQARNKLSKVLSKVRPEDVAVMLRNFTPDELHDVFQVLIADFPQAASDVLVMIEPQVRLSVFEQLSAEQVANILELAAVDDAVFLLDALPDELKQKVLEIVDLEERFAEVQEHLAYPDETAGRIMDSELVALAEDSTAAEAIEQMRKIAHDVEMISYLYVVDANGRLVGVTPLRKLLLADADARLGDIMNTSVIRVGTHTDQEEVARLSARYDLLAIPVVDDENRLRGIVTVDDILDVFKEEATEDFFKMAGTTDEELVYQDRSFKVAGIRLPWLLVNLVGLLCAGFFVGRFESTFNLAVLVSFVPVILGMAGNIGSQTSTIAVRGLATGRFGENRGRIRHFLWQQVKVGALLGVTFTTVVMVAAFAFGRNPLISLAVGTSLFAMVQVASINGVLIPVVFHRLGFDPAVASGPLVSTTNDVLGILVYFGLTLSFFRFLNL